MQIKQLAAACALALGVAASAHATVTPFQAPDLTVYLSGASGPDNFLAGIASSMFAGAKGTDWFMYKDSGSSGKAVGAAYTAYFGTLKTTTDIPAALRGKNVLLIKRSRGGSFMGIGPVLGATPIAVLNVASGACALDTAAGYTSDYLCSEKGLDPGVAGYPNGQEMVPAVGASDVNPIMFQGPLNVEYGFSAPSASDITSKLTVKSYNVLTEAMVATTSVPDTVELTQANYAAMLKADMYLWSQVAPTMPTPAAGDQVIVCRRAPGSGTQTMYNWMFGNFPCTGSNKTAPATMDASAGYRVSGAGTSADPYVIDPSLGPTFIENPGSGDVRNCLSKAQNGGDHTFKSPDGTYYKVPFGSGGYGAIGVLSVDSIKSNNGWSFRGFNGTGSYTWNGSSYVASAGATGVLPTKQNLLEGRTQFGAEATMQYLNTLSGNAKAFADEFIRRAGDPVNNTSEWVAAVPSLYTPTLDTSGNVTNNVSKATRYGNMCMPLQKLY